jgi:hypothetical protein
VRKNREDGEGYQTVTERRIRHREEKRERERERGVESVKSARVCGRKERKKT